MSLLANWRAWFCVLLLAVGAWGGWKLKPEPSPVLIDKVQERVITRTVTVERKPDGTVIEKTEEKDENSSSVVAKPAPVVRKPKWSLEVQAKPKREDLMKPDWQAMVYHRVSDYTNAWVGAGYSFADRAILLGVRLDF